MRGLRFAFLAAVAASSLTLVACAGGRAESTTPPPPGGGRGGGGGAVPVTVAEVVQKAMPLQVRAIGTVEPSQVVAVRAQLTGELTSVRFTEGDDVKEGQVLFTLDRRPLEAALKQAEANLERDIAQSANAVAQAKRYDDLANKGIATKEQVDTANANSIALGATVGADRAAVENARVQLQYATIAAPLSGRTGQLMVHPGNLVRANDATSLVVINQLTPTNVTFAIPEAQLPDLKRYLAQGAVPVDADPPNDDTPASHGRVTFVDNSVDMSTGTIKVKGSFPNTDRRLWPGQYVNVIVTLTTDRTATVMPLAALQNGPQGTYVYVVKSDQTADLRPVTVARQTGTEVIMKDGVKPGDTVVTDGQLRLVPGSRVSIKKESGRSGS